jgi:hypothetical protein
VGILPIGLNIQRDNRAETIINQDAIYWMEALRGGAQQSADDLTNYVDEITVNGTRFLNVWLNPGANPSFRNGREIMGLLSTVNPGSNDVRAIVRTISGAGTEKAAVAASWAGQELAVRYQLIARVSTVDTNSTVSFNQIVGAGVESLADASEPRNQLLEIELRFRWPVVGNDVRNSTRRKVYRSMASRYVLIDTNTLSPVWLYYLVQ